MKLQIISLVQEGKIYPGIKLNICGAKLVGSEQGIAPLEVSESTFLLLHANGTRFSSFISFILFSSGVLVGLQSLAFKNKAVFLFA